MTTHVRHKGFTLLELIIVIIVVGVLASLALPRFSRMIEQSNVSEALMRTRQAQNTLEFCFQQNMGLSYFPCPGVIAQLQEYNNEPNQKFFYLWSFGTLGGIPIYVLRIFQFKNGTVVGANEIRVTRTTTGNITVVGTGLYSNINL